MTAPIHFGRVVRAAVVLSTVLCACFDDEPVVNPPIASVEILPSRVSVPAGASVTVRARVRDEWGNALSGQRAAGIKWTSPAGLSVPSEAGNTITVTANSSPGTLPFAAELIASIDGKSATGKVTILGAAPDAGAKVDWIASDVAPEAPTIAVVTGLAVEGASQIPRVDTVIGFSTHTPLDRFECFPAPAKCGDVAIFHYGHAPTRASAGWTNRCDFVSFAQGVPTPASCSAITPAPPLPLTDPVHVPVFIWKAASGWKLDQKIRKDVEHARKVIEGLWSGLKLDVVIKDTYPASIIRGPKCQSLDEYDVTKQLPGISATEFKKDRITVVYVEEISIPDPSVPNGSIPTGELAYTCAYDATEGAIILMAGSGHLNTNLAHEFGHALGQWPAPAPVHPDWLSGFDASNLMWSEETDRWRATREYITLGQWYQMTLAQSAFIRRSGLAPVVPDPCQVEFAEDGFCPWIGKDISK